MLATAKSLRCECWLRQRAICIDLIPSNDIISSIATLDADVISIEASRSEMNLLRAFSSFRYPNETDLGVRDIHSPRAPSTDEMLQLIRAAMQVIPPECLWTNPDCGLKTRRWEEVIPALKSPVAVALSAREFRECERNGVSI